MRKRKQRQQQTTKLLLLLLGSGGALFGALALLLLLPQVRAVSVADVGGSLGLTSADLIDTVIRVINWALGLLGLIAVSIVLWGGYVWLTSAGNEERIDKAKRIIRNAVIGIVIILFSWAIVNFVIDRSGSIFSGGEECSVVGEEQGCSRCNEDHEWEYIPELCSLPENRFEIRSITTTCGNPPTYNDDVYRCSAVAVNFNHTVDTANLQSLVETGGASVDFPNRTFEAFSDTRDDGMEDTFSGWVKNNGAVGAERLEAVGDRHEGETAVSVTATAGGLYRGIRSADIPVTAGEERTYVQSAWIKVPDGVTLTGNWTLDRHARIGGGCPGGTCHHYTILGGDYTWNNGSIAHGTWVRKWVRFRTQAPVSELIGFVITVTADGGGRVLVDDMRFDEETGDPGLQVAQCNDGAACTSTSQPSPLFASTPPAIRYSGGSPTGTQAEFVAGGRSVSFLHSHELFAENTWYKLTIPKVVQDTAGLALSGCKGADGAQLPGCNDVGAAFEWIFRVGTLTDTVSPTVRSSYPVMSGGGYPNRNVNRNPILWARFGEAMAPWQMTEANITVTGFTTQPDEGGEGGTLGTPLDPGVYNVAANEAGDGFELSFTPGFSLDAFAWYQIDVKNQEDLCANDTDPPTYSWRFETNGLAAGISYVHPSDGFAFACADTDVFIQFNTSMFNPDTHSCEVSIGYVESGTSNPDMPTRIFRVMDNLPSDPDADPNDYCKQYGFEPPSGLLSYDQAYAMDIRTTYVIDESGTTLSKSDWDFSTASSAATCVNEPYISRLSPSAGTVGACLSVIGGNFDPAGVAPPGRGPNDTLKFTDADASSLTWTDNAIVATAPANPPGRSSVQVTVDYGGVIGRLASNQVDFTYQSGSAAAGPCLTELAPSSGTIGQSYQLRGTRFDPDSDTKRIHFDGPPPIAGSWVSDTNAQSTVPGHAPVDRVALVSLENDAGRSNELPFTVQSVPAGVFRVVDTVPICDSACPNTNVRARFSKALSPATVTASTVELFRCATAACEASGLTKVTADPAYVAGQDFILFSPAAGLELGKSYRAVIHGTASGVRSVDTDELTNLNYDTDDAGTENDAVSWTFTTAASAGECDLSYVDVQPVSSSVALNGTRGYAAFPYSDPNECNPAGEELDPRGFTWSWASSTPADVSVAATTEHVTDATGLRATLLPAQVRASTEGKNDFGTLAVLPNQCVTDADCATDDSGYDCSGSRCIDSVCSPVVRSVSPGSGAVGNWVTLNACYIGPYVDGQSTVTFLGDTGDEGDDRVGVWPSPSICGAAGSTWREDLHQIIVEVPNKSTATTSDDITVTGPLRVRRGQDGSAADSATSYDPHGAVIPGICSVSPEQGSAGVTRVTVRGQNFGATRTSGTDFVMFYNNQRVADADTTWTDDTEVSAVVPQGATNNGLGGEITLTNDGQTSPPFEFGVVPASCQVCATDNDCPDAASPNPEQYGCGFDGPFRCCALRPRPTDTRPTSPPTVCRNAAISGNFFGEGTGLPMEMNRSTITPSTITLEKNVSGSWVGVPLSASSFRFPTNYSYSINPGLLDANTEYRVTVVGDPTYDGVPAGAQNTKRVAPSFTWTHMFTTDDSVCELDSLRLEPASFLFTAFGDGQAIQATALADDGTEIVPAPGLYDWDLSWTTGSVAVATVTETVVGGRVDDAQTVTSVGNGGTVVTVTAEGTAGWTGTKTAQASVSVSSCVAPWPSAPPYLDPLAPSMHFSFWFCRDGGDLPDFRAVAGSSTPETPGVDEELRQFFFENTEPNPATGKNDAIGFLVWENEDRLSPAAWYQKKFGESAPGASTTDGYQSIRVGNTVYVAGTNLSGGTLYTNMYVLGVNDDANEDTMAAYAQVLANFHLNANAGDFGGPVALEQVRRDTKRVADLNDYAEALATYERVNGSFPALTAGTYLEGMSVSKWPSWDETFNAALASAGASVGAVDPTNAYAPLCSGSYASDTCWDDAAKRFFCPADSRVYAYVADSANAAHLYAHLEYLGTGSWRGSDVNPCSGTSSCACFNYAQQVIGGAARSDDDRADSSLEVSAAAATRATVADTEPPGDLGGLAVAARGDSAALSWTDPDDADLSGVALYRMDGDRARFTPTDIGVTRVATVARGVGSATVEDLRAGTTATFGLFAYDGAGNVSDGVFASVTPAAAVNEHPIERLAVSEGSGELQFAWSNPASPDYAGVRIRRSTARFPATPDEGEQVADVGPEVSLYRDTGLANGALYYYAFFARSSNGAFADAVTKAATPGEPTFDASLPVFYAYGTDEAVTLAWRKPAEARYAGVRIRRSTEGYPATPDEGELVAEVAADAAESEYVVDKTLTNGTQYYYSAFSYDGRPSYASAVYATATPDDVAPTITVVAVPPISIGEDTLTVTWHTSEPAYSILHYGSGEEENTATLVDGELTTEHRMDLRQFGAALVGNTSYSVQVVAVDAQGNVAEGESFAVVTDLRDSAGVVWHGYAGSRRIATWNGCIDTAACDAGDLQYYACTSDGLPACDDPRNGAADGVPGASVACGALAYADCLDGTVDLALGKDALRYDASDIVMSWSGSRLPTKEEYQTACTIPPRLLAAPLTDGTWTVASAGATQQEAFVAGDPRACGTVTKRALNGTRPFSIVTAP